jgi:hypothetical protein
VVRSCAPSSCSGKTSALKQIKRQLKDATTDDERMALLEKKRQIEEHVAEVIRQS